MTVGELLRIEEGLKIILREEFGCDAKPSKDKIEDCVELLRRHLSGRVRIEGGPPVTVEFPQSLFLPSKARPRRDNGQIAG